MPIDNDEYDEDRCNRCGQHRDNCDCCYRCGNDINNCDCCHNCDSLNEDCTCNDNDEDQTDNNEFTRCLQCDRVFCICHKKIKVYKLDNDYLQLIKYDFIQKEFDLSV